MTEPRAAAEEGTVTLPVALTWCGAQPLVTFGSVPVDRLKAPFWDDVLAHRVCITGFAALDALDLDDRDLGLAGALFHTNRCGSTLVVRQFSALARVIALGEPFVFQHLLDGPPAPPRVTCRRIRQLVAAHRAGLAPIADRMVVKWPGLLGQHAAEIEDALPEVPMVFLHRDATEVLESVKRFPLGGDEHARPEHFTAGLALPEARAASDSLGRSALMIAGSCAHVGATRRVRALGYEHLPDASWSHVAPFFGLHLSAADRDAMRAAAATHSKDATNRRAFGADGIRKRRGADEHVWGVAQRLLGPAIEGAVGRMESLLPHLRRSPWRDEADAG